MSGGGEIADRRWQKSVPHPAFSRLLAIGCRLLAIGYCLSVPAPLLVNTNSGGGPDEIPPLRPPKPEIPPGVWEQHGLSIVLGAAAAILALGLLWRWVSRPKPVIPPDPAAVARAALEGMSDRAEDAALLSEVSGILRAYLRAALALPGEALTNMELCQRLDAASRLGTDLTTVATDLLLEMEHRRFNEERPAGGAATRPAPLEDEGPTPDDGSVVARALWVVRKTEEALHPPKPAGAATTADA